MTQGRRLPLQRQLLPTVNERFNLTSTERFFGLLKVATIPPREPVVHENQEAQALCLYDIASRVYQHLLPVLASGRPQNFT